MEEKFDESFKDEHFCFDFVVNKFTQQSGCDLHGSLGSLKEGVLHFLVCSLSDMFDVGEVDQPNQVRTHHKGDEGRGGT